MRLLFISQYFYPEQFFHNDVAAHMADKGHDVHVLCGVPNYGRTSFFDGYGNNLKRTESWRSISISRAWSVARGNSRIRLLINYLVYPVTALWTFWRNKIPKPDVSLVSMPSPIFQAFVGIALQKIMGVPCVLWVQDIWPESATYTLSIHNPVVTKLLHAFCGFVYRQADYILVQSPGFIPMISRFGIPEVRIAVLSNPAPALYRPVLRAEAIEEEKLLPASGFRIIFAGNIGESQDFDTLVAAAALLKEHTDIVWIILGSGRGEARARRQVAEQGLERQFHFLGRFPEDRMPLFFAHADVLLASLKDTPIFALTIPSKIQSYMACGKPILASLAGEGKRIIEEAKCGLAVPPGRPELLAQAILDLKATSPEQRVAFGKAGRQFYEANYALDRIGANLEAVLNDIVNIPSASVSNKGSCSL